MNIRDYLVRLKNPGVIVGIAGYIIIILVNLGIEVDNAAVMNIVNAACSILIVLGVMNNPDTSGTDLPTHVSKSSVTVPEIDRSQIRVEMPDRTSESGIYPPEE